MKSRLSVILLIIAGLFACFAPAVYAADQIVSGPFSLTVNSGARNDSGYIGLEGRLDYLNPVINFHAVALYDILDSHQGMGAIDTERYGAAVALSHTYAKKANAYIGFSLLNEMGHNFTHAYMGGKLKLTDHFIASAAFGIGFGPEHFIDPNNDGLGILAEAENWVKVGGIYVFDNALKTNLYAYMNSVGQDNIFGVEGQISYPLTEALTIGLRGMTDIGRRHNSDTNFNVTAFLTYAYGSQKGTVIDVALEKNNPISFPTPVVENDVCRDRGYEKPKEAFLSFYTEIDFDSRCGQKKSN